MFVDKNILAGAIAEGKDPESIAQEMIAALNEAIALNKEAEEAAKAEKAQLEAAGILLAAFTSYIADYCPNMVESVEDDLEPEDIVEIMAMMDEGFIKSKDLMNKVAQSIDDLFQMFVPKEAVTAGGSDLQPLQVEPGTSPKMPVSIADFLKANGL